MKSKIRNVFILMLIASTIIFFLPKVNSAALMHQDTYVIEDSEFIAADVGYIPAGGFIRIEYTQDNPDIVLEMWAMDDDNYNNYIQYGSGAIFVLAYDEENYTDYFFPNYADTWHILIHNVDFLHHRTTTLHLTLYTHNSDQNDGGSGQDAGDYFASAYYLENENFNSSGKLVYNDIIDFYKFYFEEGNNISIKINGLDKGITSFVLYAPNGFTVIASADDIIEDIEFNLQANYTGFWIMKFYKDEVDLLYSEYFFDIVAVVPPTISIGFSYSVIIAFSFSIFVVTIITKKKMKH